VPLTGRTGSRLVVGGDGGSVGSAFRGTDTVGRTGAGAGAGAAGTIGSALTVAETGRMGEAVSVLVTVAAAVRTGAAGALAGGVSSTKVIVPVVTYGSDFVAFGSAIQPLTEAVDFAGIGAADTGGRAGGVVAFAGAGGGVVAEVGLTAGGGSSAGGFG
jgi:hypothetical protein